MIHFCKLARIVFSESSDKIRTQIISGMVMQNSAILSNLTAMDSAASLPAGGTQKFLSTSSKPPVQSASLTALSPGSSGYSPVLSLLHRVNSFVMQDFQCSYGGLCKPLLVKFYQVGIISRRVESLLSLYPHVFVVTPSAIIVNEQLSTYDSLTVAFDAVLRDLRKNKETIALRSWRDENFTVWGQYGREPLFEIERAAVALLGIRAFGTHVTGFVRGPDGSVAGVWFQKRADNKPTYPGMMDTMVGGGITAGLTASQVVVKESEEEASIPQHIIETVKPVGTVSFFTNSERGIHANTEHVYDLELPLGYEPSNSDGEVQDFKFVQRKDLLNTALDPNFKLTSTPILIDFLIRHGILTSDSLPDFPEVVEMLHVSLSHHYRARPKEKYAGYRFFDNFEVAQASLPGSVSSMKISDTEDSDTNSEDMVFFGSSDTIFRLDSNDETVYY